MERLQNSGSEYHWTCRAVLGEVDKICVNVADILKKYPAAKKDCFAIGLLLRETLNNAIIHGSKQDQDRTIFCQLNISPQGAGIVVMDQGPGFNWRAALENPNFHMNESGRGMAIIRKYATSFSFNVQGNKITMWRVFQKGEQHD